MADRFDPKDFVDLYFVIKKKDLNLQTLVQMTVERFDIKGLDFVIPERLMMVKKIGPKDLPLMVENFDLDEMKRYIIQQASRLVKQRKDR